MNPIKRWLENRRANAIEAVLVALDNGPLAGWPIMRITGMSGPRVYAALERLQARGVVTRRRDGAGWLYEIDPAWAES